MINHIEDGIIIFLFWVVYLVLLPAFVLFAAFREIVEFFSFPIYQAKRRRE